MDNYYSKYIKYKKKYLDLKKPQHGGSIGIIRDMSEKGDLTLVKNDGNGKYFIIQGDQKADIVNFEEICPNTHIFITNSGSVYKYTGELRHGRITA